MWGGKAYDVLEEEFFEFSGVQFFDKNEVKILEAGYFSSNSAVSKEFILEEGQRIIGVKSKLVTGFINKPRMVNLVFVIGWLE